MTRPFCPASTAREAVHAAARTGTRANVDSMLLLSPAVTSRSRIRYRSSWHMVHLAEGTSATLAIRCTSPLVQTRSPHARTHMNSSAPTAVVVRASTEVADPDTTTKGALESVTDPRKSRGLLARHTRETEVRAATSRAVRTPLSRLSLDGDIRATMRAVPTVVGESVHSAPRAYQTSLSMEAALPEASVTIATSRAL
jgi:hypothetical protein